MSENSVPYEVATRETTPGEVAPPNQQSAFFTAIERLASNPDVDVNKIQQLMDMQEKILNRAAQQSFNAAMGRAQKNMPVVGKRKKNEQTHSKYAGYEDIIRICQPIYTKEGLSVAFYQGHGTTDDPLAPDMIRVMADVMHEDGHTKIVHVDIPVETTGIKGNANMTKTHATGSAFSYGKNYLVRLIFNIPTGDEDDGNGAGGVQYITEDQKGTIVDYLSATDSDVPTFLKYLGVEAVDKITARDYNKAIAALKAKEKQAKGGGK